MLRILLLPALLFSSSLLAQEEVTFPGRVVIPEGAPAEKLTVTCRGNRNESGTRMIDVPVAEDGTFVARFAEDTRFGRCTLNSDHLVCDRDTVRLKEGAEFLLEARMGGTLTLRLDPPQELHGTRVDLYLVPRSPYGVTDRVLQATLGETTELVVRPLDTQEDWYVRWEGAGILGGRQQATLPEIRGERPMKLAIGVGATLEGMVSDQNGVGRRASIVVEDIRGKRLLTGHSELDGTFLLTGIPPEAYKLVVKRFGAHDATLLLDELAPGTNRTGLSIESADALGIEGTVFDAAGEPARGATVVSFPEEVNWNANIEPGNSLTYRATLSSGRFHLKSVREESMRVLVALQEESGRHSYAVLSDVPPSTEPLTVFLRPGPEVTVEIPGASGGTLTLRRPNEAWPEHDDELFFKEETIVDGHVRFDSVCPGEWIAEIASPDFAFSRHPVRVEVGERAHLELTPQPLSTLSGVVRHPDGSPFAGEPVFLTDRYTDLFHDAEEVGVTDDQGRFEVTDLSPDRYAVGFGEVSNATYVQLYGEASIEHVQEPLARVTFQVDKSAEGSFYISHEGSNWLHSTFHQDIDENGQAFVLLAAGKWRVLLHNDDTVDNVMFELEPGETRTILVPHEPRTDEAAPQGKSFSGEVVDDRGAPCDHVLVRLHDAEGWESTWTEEDGRFTFDSVADGPVHVSVSGYWLPSNPRGRAGGAYGVGGGWANPPAYTTTKRPWGQRVYDFDEVPQSLRVHLSPAGALRGYVTDATGAAVYAAGIRLETTDGVPLARGASVYTNEDGRYVLRGVDPGPYKMIVLRDHYRSEQLIHVAEGWNDQDAELRW